MILHLHDMSSEVSKKNWSSVKDNLRASNKILNQSEQSYCFLIGQYFHKSELMVCKVHMFTATPHFDTEINYMNQKNNPDDMS